MTQQFAYKTTDLLLADVVEEEQVVEAQPMPAWAERNAGDDTDLVPPPLAMDGRLSRGSPGENGRSIPHRAGNLQHMVSKIHLSIERADATIGGGTLLGVS